VKRYRKVESPRERVELLVLLAVNAERLLNHEALMASLRRVIAETECQPDPPTPEWDFGMLSSSN